MKNVKELRKQTGMSQSQFATYFDIPVRTLQDWEQERRQPPEYLVRLMERLLRYENLI